MSAFVLMYRYSMGGSFLATWKYVCESNETSDLLV
jgi:hypothetical protein